MFASETAEISVLPDQAMAQFKRARVLVKQLNASKAGSTQPSLPTFSPGAVQEKERLVYSVAFRLREFCYG